MKLYLSPSGAQMTIDAGGVTRVKDGRLTHYAIKTAANNLAAVATLHKDRLGNLWIREGENLYLLRDGQITAFHVTPEQIRPMGDSEQVRFKYKLEGLDSDWVDAGTRRVAYFPYLPPGNYTFRVIAANCDGVWNMEGLVTIKTCDGRRLVALLCRTHVSLEYP